MKDAHPYKIIKFFKKVLLINDNTLIDSLPNCFIYYMLWIFYSVSDHVRSWNIL